MNKKYLSYFITAVVITTAVYFFNKSSKPKTEIVSEEETDVAATENSPAASIKVDALRSSDVSAMATASQTPAEAQVESREQKLIKEGYVQDPDRAERMMKKYVDKDGTTRTTYVDKVEEGFTPNDRTVKGAQETLISKRSADPVEEVRTLGRIDESNINSAMLNGYFRDDANDIELNFAQLTDGEGQRRDYDKGCFMAPRLGFKFENSYEKYTVHTDETGYGIANLSKTVFVRITWSWEKRRVLHGELVSVENGQSKIVKSFSATEVRSTDRGQLKYCKE